MIDPTARVDSGATIGENVSIGPYCIVGADVVIGEGCRLVAHVHVTGHTTLGPRTVVYPFASLGTPPQSVHYHGEPTRLEIGADCDIREGVIVNIATTARGVTSVGDTCFLMGNSHVAHDCVVGNNVTFAQGATLGGHCEVGDFVFLGGLSAVHQFTRLGESAMIGGVSGVRGDVIPFGLANGDMAHLDGVNVVGMKRRGFTRESIHAVRRVARMLFDRGQGAMPDRIAAVEAEFGNCEPVQKIVAFMREAGERPLCWPRNDEAPRREES
jgi:UDP-N-acetylglucosamine acyltransferase